MNKIIKKESIIRTFIMIFSVVASVIIFFQNTSEFHYQLSFLLPLVFSILLLFCKNIKFTDFKLIGTVVLNWCMVIKYCLSPLVSSSTGFYSWLGRTPSANSTIIAIVLTLLEMITIMFFSNILYNRYIKKIKNINFEDEETKIAPIRHNIVYLIFIVLFVLVIVFVPQAISDQRFLFNQNNLDITTKIDFKFSGIYQTIFLFGRFALVLIVINYFYKRNLKKESILNVLFSFIPVVINALFTSNLSRLYILCPLLTFSTLILILYNSKKNRKIIVRVLFIIFAAILIYLSFTIFFGSGRGNESESSNIKWWGDTINMYFSGIKETAIGVESIDRVDQYYGFFRIKLFFNDLFSNVIGLSNLTNPDYNGISLYNYTYFNSSIAVCQIPPNIIMGTYYFGYAFSFILPCILVWFTYYFSFKSLKRENLTNTFVFLYSAIYCGMLLMVNYTMIVSRLVNVSILFLIISNFNNRVIIRKGAKNE